MKSRSLFIYHFLYYLEKFSTIWYKKEAFYQIVVFFKGSILISDFTNEDYNEMLSFIEEEYDYQYSMIGISSTHL